MFFQRRFQWLTVTTLCLFGFRFYFQSIYKSTPCHPGGGLLFLTSSLHMFPTSREKSIFLPYHPNFTRKGIRGAGLGIACWLDRFKLVVVVIVIKIKSESSTMALFELFLPWLYQEWQKVRAQPITSGPVVFISLVDRKAWMCSLGKRKIKGLSVFQQNFQQ